MLPGDFSTVPKPMTFYLLANHLFNLVLPAAAVAVLLVLVAGLVFFGHDGKMLTYAAMVVVAATCQWVLLGAWKA